MDLNEDSSCLYLIKNKTELEKPLFIRENIIIQYSEEFPKEEFIKDILRYDNLDGKKLIEDKYQNYHTNIVWLTITNVNINIKYILATCKILLENKSNLNAEYSIFIPHELSKAKSAIEIFANSSANYNNCIIQNSDGVGVIIRNNSVSIFDHCIFENNKVSCFLSDGSHAKFINCKFVCDKKKSIFVTKESSCEIINCEFLNLEGKAVFGKDKSKILIKNTYFKNCRKGAVTIVNQSNLFIDTGVTIESSQNASLRAINNSEIKAVNLIINKTNGNAINLKKSNGCFVNCDIKETTFPTVAIKGYGSNPKFENCNFNDNLNDFCVICKDGCRPLFIHCNFLDCLKENISIDTVSQPTLLDCNFKKIDFDDDYEEEEEDEEEEESEIYQKLNENEVKKIIINEYQIDDIIRRKSSSITYKVFKYNRKKFEAKCSLVNFMDVPKNDSNITNFINGVINHSRLSHPSIVKFKGYSPYNFKFLKNYPVIFTEFCKNGTLSDIIQKVINKEKIEWLDETQKLIIIYGIVSGMSYLHSINIIHRDLNPSNIFIDKFFNPKIGGFDFSVKINENETLSQIEVIGTSPFIAPETWRGEGYSKATDVYSFSLILYELITSELPFSNQSDFQICYNVASKNARPHINENVDINYHRLIEKCWSDDASKRPTFGQIRNDLKNNRCFITNNVDEQSFRKYVEFVDGALRL